jgi:hypothetical protein
MIFKTPDQKFIRIKSFAEIKQELALPGRTEPVPVGQEITEAEALAAGYQSATMMEVRREVNKMLAANNVNKDKPCCGGKKLRKAR